jgi:hypothetical protein
MVARFSRVDATSRLECYGMTVRRDVSGERPLSPSMLGWALDEEESIGEYIERAEKFLAGQTIDFELILIDDGSTHSTAAIIEEHQHIRPWLRLHRNPETFLKRRRGVAKGSRRGHAALDRRHPPLVAPLGSPRTTGRQEQGADHTRR